MRLSGIMRELDSGIFAKLGQIRQKRLAQGLPVYDMWVGTPDFAPDAHVMNAMREAAVDAENYKYAIYDRPFLTEAVQKWYARRYGVELTAGEITSVYGSQEGIAHIALPFCDPGDVVLAPNPGYPIFKYGPLISHARVWEYPLLKENAYLPDLGAIPADILKRTRLMIVSYPNNPVCVTAPDSFYRELIDFAKRNDILIIHDNAYSELVFEGGPGKSFLSFDGAKEVGVEFNSLSKTYNLTGLRISFCVGNAGMIGAFDRVRSQIDYGVALPVQYAAAAALNGPQDIVRRNREGYRERRDVFCNGLRAIGWDCDSPQGTMFCWVPVPKRGVSSVDFAAELVEKTGVMSVPGSAFGSLGEGYLRFALTTPAEKIAEAVEAIRRSGILLP